MTPEETGSLHPPPHCKLAGRDGDLFSATTPSTISTKPARGKPRAVNNLAIAALHRHLRNREEDRRHQSAARAAITEVNDQ